MKVLSFCILVLFISCKPEIIIQTHYPSLICDCAEGEVVYKLNHATSSTVTISPASAARTAPTTPAARGAYISSTFGICSTATVTVSSTNDNGSSSVSYTVRRVTMIDPISGTLAPLCFNGAPVIWSYTPIVIDNADNPIPSGSVINEILVTVDRSGTFIFGGVSTAVNPGANRLTNYSGRNPHASQYEFSAPLNANEECVESGSTLPSGRVPPPSFSIQLLLRCGP